MFGDIDGEVLCFDDMLIAANTKEDYDRIFLKHKLEAILLLSKENYDPTFPRKAIEYSPSDYVFMQNPITKNWEPGMIVECCEEPRSYLVRNE
ncbi:hypothetical protein FOCC_FOCC010944, partial [Frankliniella occidentalis]